MIVKNTNPHFFGTCSDTLSTIKGLFAVLEFTKSLNGGKDEDGEEEEQKGILENLFNYYVW